MAAKMTYFCHFFTNLPKNDTMRVIFQVGFSVIFISIQNNHTFMLPVPPFKHKTKIKMFEQCLNNF